MVGWQQALAALDAPPGGSTAPSSSSSPTQPSSAPEPVIVAAVTTPPNEHSPQSRISPTDPPDPVSEPERPLAPPASVPPPSPRHRPGTRVPRTPPPQPVSKRHRPSRTPTLRHDDHDACCPCNPTSTCMTAGRRGCPCRARGSACTGCTHALCANKSPTAPQQTTLRSFFGTQRRTTTPAAASTATTNTTSTQPPSVDTADLRSPPRPSRQSTPPEESPAPPATAPEIPVTDAAAIPIADPDQDANSTATAATDEQDPPPPVPPPPQEPPPPAYPPPPKIVLEPDADHMDFTPSIADLALKRVYGDWIHDNPGLDLRGGVSTDELWQRRWRRLQPYTPTLYDVPNTAVGKAVLSQLAIEFDGVTNRKWNSERPLVFTAAVLQTARTVRSAADIKARIRQRLTMWQAGDFDDLIEDVVRTLRTRRSTPRQSSDLSALRGFQARALSGRLRSATRRYTGRGQGGGALGPSDTCTKTGKPVADVLISKHPPLRDPPVDPATTDALGLPSDGPDDEPTAFEPYPRVPTAPPLTCSIKLMTQVASTLGGSGGPSGVDAVALREWLLRYGDASAKLRESLRNALLCLANSRPSWAAFRALMACRLVALDKQPGVRPVGIGEIYRRYFAKCVLAEVGEEATAECGALNLCAGLSGGIEGAIHTVRDYAVRTGISTVPLDSPATEASTPNDPEGGPPNPPDSDTPTTESPVAPTILLVDAKNGFNELSRKAALWSVRHMWPAGSLFVYNCYRHAALLVLRGANGEVEFLQSREGVTQGDPLSMFVYGITLCPLAARLREAEPAVIQPWFADDSCLAGNAKPVAHVMRELMKWGPVRGYYPEPDKSLAISNPGQREAVEAAMGDLPVRHMAGHRYVGGFIGPYRDLGKWLEPQLRTWRHAVSCLARAARHYPQIAYAAHTKCLQSEWRYVSRVTPGLTTTFRTLEHDIREVFLPALFDVDALAEPITPSLLSSAVKAGGLAVELPSGMADQLFRNSKELVAPLITALGSNAPLDAIQYNTHVSSRRHAQRSAKLERQSTLFKDTMQLLTYAQKHRLSRSTESGQWLGAIPHRLNGTELSADEFRDGLYLRYGLQPRRLPTHCDGCGDPFSVAHAMSCKVGGLIHGRHNDLRDEWAHHCDRAFPGRPVSEPSIPQLTANPDAPALRGDVGVHGFWKTGTQCVFDIRVTDLNQSSLQRKPADKVLEAQEREKKRQYLRPCRDARRHFTPLVFSADGLMGRETVEAVQHLGGKLAKKWSASYSVTVSLLRLRLSLSLVRAASRCLRGTRNPRGLPAGPPADQMEFLLH